VDTAKTKRLLHKECKKTTTVDIELIASKLHENDQGLDKQKIAEAIEEEFKRVGYG